MIAANLFAQMAQHPWETWGIAGWAIAIIILCGIIAIVVIALRYFDVWPPPWAIKIFWICVLCLVAILAIKFLVSLA